MENKTLNESVLEINDKAQVVMKPVYADAINTSIKRRKESADMFKGIEKNLPNEDRFAHAKANSTKEMKKMHLSESLFTEWIEDNNQLNESFAQPNFAVSEDQYVLDDNSGNITVSKDIFSDYIKDGHVNILFVDEAEDGEDKVLEYKMIAEDDSNIVMEYIGVATPGIDEEIADCQKYPIEKPKAKDSTYVSADDKQPKNNEEAKDSQYVSAGDKQPEKAAMKEGFNNWDSPESRIERYMTDLPELLDTMYDHYKRGNVEAQVLADALKTAYDALDSVPQIDESLEDSQKYPIEKPEAKDSQYVSAEDKQPKQHVKAKDSQFVSAGDKTPAIAAMKESMLAEADDQKESFKYFYMGQREPLGEVIQVELTEGEWGYVVSPNGKKSSTRLPSANYLDTNVKAAWDKDDRYGIYVLAETKEALAPAMAIAGKYGKEYSLEYLKRPERGNNYKIWIYLDDEDWDTPAPNGGKEIVNVVDRMSARTDNSHSKDEFEESLNTAEKEIFENTCKLDELLVQTQGLANFKPEGEVAEKTWEIIKDNLKLPTLEFFLEDGYPDGIPSVELNKLLNQRSAWVLDVLNIDRSNIATEDEEI